METKNLNNGHSAWLAALFFVLYLIAIITINEIIKTESFGYKLPHMNSNVVGSKWIYFKE